MTTEASDAVAVRESDAGEPPPEDSTVSDTAGVTPGTLAIVAAA
jgi:hypothetical protein